MVEPATYQLPDISQPGYLKLGSAGDDVRKLQNELNAFGAKLEVDGDFGERTDNAVRLFQEAHGLVKDGIVGPRTWKSIFGYRLKEDVEQDALFQAGSFEGEELISDKDALILSLLQCIAHPDPFYLLAFIGGSKAKDSGQAIGGPDFIMSLTPADYSKISAWATAFLLYFNTLTDDDNLRRTKKRFQAIQEFSGEMAFNYDASYSPIDMAPEIKALIFTALTQIGRVSALTKDPNSSTNERLGWAMLHRYCATAYHCRQNDPADVNDPDDYTSMDSTKCVSWDTPNDPDMCHYCLILKNKVRYWTSPKELPVHWCGIFTLWAQKLSGAIPVDDTKAIWHTESGYILPSGYFKTVFPPRPGDIAYKDSPYNHHTIVVRVRDGKFDTVDGNSDNEEAPPSCSSGVWMHKDKDYNAEFIDPKDNKKKKVWVFYRRKAPGDGGGSPPVPPPSGGSTPGDQFTDAKDGGRTGYEQGDTTPGYIYDDSQPADSPGGNPGTDGVGSSPTDGPSGSDYVSGEGRSPDGGDDQSF